MKELVILSTREIRRIQIFEQISKGTLSLVVGAEVLKIIYRHAKRLLARYRLEGPPGLAHRQRGRPARNAFGPEMRERVLTIHQEHYSQSNDSHFVEMLKAQEDIRISRETVRRWFKIRISFLCLPHFTHNLLKFPPADILE